MHMAIYMGDLWFRHALELKDQFIFAGEIFKQVAGHGSVNLRFIHYYFKLIELFIYDIHFFQAQFKFHGYGIFL